MNHFLSDVVKSAVVIVIATLVVREIDKRRYKAAK